MRGHGSQWISYKINIRHPLQLKKSKSWELFRSYQLNSAANPAHLPQNLDKLAKSAVPLLHLPSHFLGLLRHVLLIGKVFHSILPCIADLIEVHKFLLQV